MPIRDHNPSGKFPLITIGIIIVNVAVFIFQLFLSQSDFDNLIQGYALVPTLINFSNISSLTPFITSLFLHAGLIHTASNMLFLWVFGDNIEAALGKTKFIIFYLAGGVLAGLGQFIFVQGSSVPIVGASGAVAAVLGAYLILHPRARIDMIIPIFFIPMIIPVPAAFMLIYWFVVQIISGLSAVSTQTASLGGIAFMAHAAGFLSGIVLIRFFTLKKHIAKAR